MKQIRMTFPNYPMLGYFLNMFNHSQYTPQYTLTMSGPATEAVTVDIQFTDKNKEPDLEAIHKMFSASSSLSFTVMEDMPLVMESQFVVVDHGSIC